MRHLLITSLALIAGCSNLDLDPQPALIHARFDPDARVIPMPTDVLRDAALGRLELPNDTAEEKAKLTAAEAEFFDYLETLDGWSTLMSATVEFTGAIDPTSVTDGTVQVWHWGADARARRRRADLGHRGPQEADDRSTARRLEAWRPLRRDRARRQRTAWSGSSASASSATPRSTSCARPRASTRPTTSTRSPATRRQSARTTRPSSRRSARTSPARSTSSPMRSSIPRDEVAALWAFTVTTHTELAMDQPSQRMPLPIDLMIEPSTGKVDAPAAPWDTAGRGRGEGPPRGARWLRAVVAADVRADRADRSRVRDRAHHRALPDRGCDADAGPRRDRAPRRQAARDRHAEVRAARGEDAVRARRPRHDPRRGRRATRRDADRSLPQSARADPRRRQEPDPRDRRSRCAARRDHARQARRGARCARPRPHPRARGRSRR